jgi:hypothetical protein
VGDYVNVDRKAALKGLDEWDAAASELRAQWKKCVSKIQALQAAAPWGGGADGDAFHASFTANGGPDAFFAMGDGIMDEGVDLGKRVRTAVNRTHATDSELAAIINPPEAV